MAIRPGKCPTLPDGTPNCPPFTEKDCIEVLKVYDQCVKEDELVSFNQVDAVICNALLLPIQPTDVITCTVTTPLSCTVTFGDFTTPFFRKIRVFQSIGVNVVVTRDAVQVCNFNTTLSSFQTIVLWAPPGTFVECVPLTVGECTCELVEVNGQQFITCSVTVCKDIQVKAFVKLLVPSYGFCEQVPCQPAPEDGIECPPEPKYPTQLCQFPPVVTIQDNGVGIQGVVVNIDRNAQTITKTTVAPNGDAVFDTIGAIAGGIDVIRFVLDSKQVVFAVPVEFLGADGNLHDSATACTIRFNRIATSPTQQFEVFIDNVQLQGVIDP